MRNQYFGDSKDLLKFDLIEKVLAGIPSLERFTYIVTLTDDQEMMPGSKLGSNNRQLVEFLEKCLWSERKQVREIVKYYEPKKTVHIYDVPFKHATRRAYFDRIPLELLQNSLVSLDPDIGFQSQAPDERHLRFEEAANVLGKMDDSSILMVFQHLRQGKKLADTIKDINLKLREACDQQMKVSELHELWISGAGVDFLFVTRSPKQFEQLHRIATEYREAYPEKTKVWH